MSEDSSRKLHRVPFEEALDLTGFGKYNVLMGAVCSFMVQAMVFETLSVSYLVPASACELGTTKTNQGLMAAMPLIGIITTSHLWGYQADMRGRRKILRLTLVLGFIGSILSAFSPHWIVFCAFKLLSCSAVSGTFALAFTLLGETTPSHRRNVLIIMTSSQYLFSMGLMAVITIPVLPLTFSYYIPYLGIYFNSWRVLSIIFSIPCALASGCVSFVHESPKYLLSMRLEDKALAVLRSMYVTNTGKNPEDFQVKSIALNEDGTTQPVYKSVWASVKAQTLPLVTPPLLEYTALLSIMIAMVYFSINPFIVWMPSIADGFMRSIQRGETDLTICQMLRSTQDSKNQTAFLEEAQDCSLNREAMIIVLINTSVLAALNIFTSGLVNCIGRKRLLILVQIITGTAGVCVNFSSYWVVTALFFIVFMANCINFGVLTTFSVNIFPTYLKAMAVCLTLMAGRASSIVGIYILNQMLVTNCELAFYLFGGLTIAGGLVGLLLPAQDPQHKPEEKKPAET